MCAKVLKVGALVSNAKLVRADLPVALGAAFHPFRMKAKRLVDGDRPPGASHLNLACVQVRRHLPTMGLASPASTRSQFKRTHYRRVQLVQDFIGREADRVSATGLSPDG